MYTQRPSATVGNTRYLTITLLCRMARMFESFVEDLQPHRELVPFASCLNGYSPRRYLTTIRLLARSDTVVPHGGECQ